MSDVTITMDNVTEEAANEVMANALNAVTDEAVSMDLADVTDSAVSSVDDLIGEAFDKGFEEGLAAASKKVSGLMRKAGLIGGVVGTIIGVGGTLGVIYLKHRMEAKRIADSVIDPEDIDGDFTDVEQ